MAALVVAACLAGGASAQTSPAVPAAAAPSAASAAAPASEANAAFLAKASQLYYSTSKAGLKSFDCVVHPE